MARPGVEDRELTGAVPHLDPSAGLRHPFGFGLSGATVGVVARSVDTPQQGDLFVVDEGGMRFALLPDPGMSNGYCTGGRFDSGYFFLWDCTPDAEGRDGTLQIWRVLD